MSAARVLTPSSAQPRPLVGPTKIRCDEDCPRCETCELHEAFREVWLATGPPHDRPGELFATGEILGAMQVKRGGTRLVGGQPVEVTFIEYLRRA